MNAYEKIRAALEMATGGRPSNIAAAQEALAALAELERAAAEPVAWCNPSEFASFVGKPRTGAQTHALDVFSQRGGRDTMPLYAAPPAPVAEIREPTPEECARICTEYERLLMREGTCGGRDAFDAVKDVMWPKEGES